MNPKQLPLLLFTVFIFSFAFVFSASAQAPQISNRERTYDVQHYIIRSKFDRKAKIYYGDSTVVFKPLKAGFNILNLDAAGMKYESIKLGDENGGTLQYKQTGDKLAITLDKAYAPTDTVAVRIKYSAAQPSKGVYFVDAQTEGGKITRPSQVWTQCEAEEARHWFPSYDSPDDKATTEQYITTPKDETAIANGELLETTENADGTKTFHYKMPVPHSTYLTSMIVGNYVKVEEKYKDIPLGYYVYPGMESIVPKAYGKTPEMMRVFEELTGVDFPYNKYDQTIVANFNFGGMENITATTMADSEILAANYDFGRELVVDLVSHELAHSWFGDLVTTKNWSNLWLNEGFATFMEAAYREKVNGRADYMRKVRSDAMRWMGEDSAGISRHPLMRPNAPTDDSLFDTTTYQKGGAVIHTLREELGTEIFWKAVNAYLNKYKFSNVESPDFQKSMEEASGKDLSWFFNQWVYKGGFPRLNVKHVYSPATKKLTLTVTQIQRADSITPSAFVLPMEVEIVTAKVAKIEKIQIDKRTQVFTLAVDGKPSEINFDKDEKIPLKIVKLLPALGKQNPE
jgi:aminopeptidase N